MENGKLTISDLAILSIYPTPNSNNNALISETCNRYGF